MPRQFDEYYKLERTVTDAQIVAFVDVVNARQLEESRAYGAGVFHFFQGCKKDLADALACGFDLDNHGNTEAIRLHPHTVAVSTERSAAYDARCKVDSDARSAKLLAAIEAVGHPAIRAYRIEQHAAKARGLSEPKAVDHSGWCALAKRDDRKNPGTRQQYGKPPYSPTPGGKYRLVLAQGISYGHLQEAYADHSLIAFPVKVDDNGDAEVSKRNLAHFGESIRTATGWAGEGSTWDFQLIERPEGVFVLANGRHSIAD